MQRVSEPLLSGADGHDFAPDNHEYVRDLNLIAPRADLCIAIPIYECPPARADLRHAEGPAPADRVVRECGRWARER